MDASEGEQGACLLEGVAVGGRLRQHDSGLELCQRANEVSSGLEEQATAPVGERRERGLGGRGPTVELRQQQLRSSEVADPDKRLDTHGAGELRDDLVQLVEPFEPRRDLTPGGAAGRLRASSCEANARLSRCIAPP